MSGSLSRELLALELELLLSITMWLLPLHALLHLANGSLYWVLLPMLSTYVKCRRDASGSSPHSALGGGCGVFIFFLGLFPSVQTESFCIGLH